MLSRRVDQTNNKQQHNFTPSSKVLGVKAEKRDFAPQQCPDYDGFAPHDLSSPDYDGEASYCVAGISRQEIVNPRNCNQGQGH